MNSEFQPKNSMYLKGLKQLTCAKLNLRPSSHGLQGSNHTEVLFVVGFIFAALSPQNFGKETQLISSGCKNKGCLLSLNHAIITVFLKPKYFYWLKLVNFAFRHREQNFFHLSKRHVDGTFSN